MRPAPLFLVRESSLHAAKLSCSLGIPDSLCRKTLQTSFPSATPPSSDHSAGESGYPDGGSNRRSEILRGRCRRRTSKSSA